MSGHPGKAALANARRYANMMGEPIVTGEMISLIAGYVAELEAELEVRGSAVLDLQVQVSTARNAALEEAAEVAELFHQRDYDGTQIIHPVRDRIATAIRALKAKP